MSKMLNTRNKIILPLIIMGLLAFLLFSLSNKAQAPNVTFTTIEGKAIKMADLKGKIVLVDFWATDCPGCIVEMPKFIETYNKYHALGFELIAVAMPYDPPSQVLNYSKKNALPFPVMQDSLGEVSNRFDDVRLTPTAFIIDKQGKIVRKVIGDMDFVALHTLLDAQLGSKS